MKTILSAVLALPVLTGVAGSVSAADSDWTRDFWKQLERNLP